MKITKTITLLLAATAVLATATSARSAVIFNGFSFFTDDIKTCNDVVRIEGDLHSVISQTVDRGGRIHIHVLSHPKAIAGVSLITGMRYIGAGANTFSVNAVFPSGDGTASQVVQIVLVGETGQTVVMQAHFKVTIANGQVRVFFDRITDIKCP